MTNPLVLLAKLGLILTVAFALQSAFVAPDTEVGGGETELDPTEPVLAKKCCQPRSPKPAPPGQAGDGCYTPCTDGALVCDPAATVTTKWIEAKCCSHSKPQDSTCNKTEEKLHKPKYNCTMAACTFDDDGDPQTPKVPGRECKWALSGVDTSAAKQKTTVCSGTPCASLNVNC